VDGERYRQLRPRARELIDQEANENLVGNMWFNIDDDSNLKRERKLFLAEGFFLLQSLGCEKP
jgi:hypothetical protein